MLQNVRDGDYNIPPLIPGVPHVRRAGAPVQLLVPQHHAVPAAHAGVRPLVHGQLHQLRERL